MTSGQLTVREEQLAVTRRRILEACAELALRHGGLEDPNLFTYARVAELAGVSERTVYRAFPTKADLTAAFLQESTMTHGQALPREPAQLAPFLRDVCTTWDAQFPSRPRHAAEGEPETQLANRASSDRDAALRAALSSILPADITTAQRQAVFGVVRTVWSIRNVAHTAARVGVTLREAGEAHAWALDTLVTALQAGTSPWTNQ